MANRISIGLGAFGEVNFYNNVRSLLPIEAPKSYFANINAKTRNSIVMLEDLGHTTTFCTHTTDITYDLAKKQMGVLAQLHGQFLESSDLDGLLQIFPTWTDFFVPLETLFKVPCDEGFAMAKDVIPSRLFSRRDAIWEATLRSVEQHRHLPHTLNHGDVHLRNWYITADGKMGLNDWQNVIRGHWSRDVAYALTTSLTIKNRREWEQELLRYYAEQLQAVSGKVVTFDEVWSNYRQQLFTALAYWTITINPAPGMPDMQPRDVSVEFIKRITAAMDDVDSLGSFESL
ncbi:MAG: phosphotransferase [Tissierellales bacterium]